MIREYLGLLKFQNFNERKEKISEENKGGIALILLFYSVILLLNIAGVLFRRQNLLQNESLVLELVYMIISVPLYFFVLRQKKLNFTALIYLFEIPLLLISILHGTFWDPHSLTFTFLLFILVLPLLILDKPWRVILLIVGMTGIYIMADLVSKDPHLFPRDLMHAFNACLMSTAATLYTLSVRIQNINYADYYKEKADRDPLTGLYNRFGAERHMHTGQAGLMVYMDLDRFKEVNDEFGHDEGDRVLQKTAETLRSCFRKDDILIRMGGDEFAVFAPGTWTTDQITRKMSEVLKKVETIQSSDTRKKVEMTVSIGCAYTPDGSENPDELIRQADMKMYQVKKNGKDDYAFTTVKKEAF